MIGMRDAAELGARGYIVVTINFMRQQWTNWRGDDSLHEMAFGQPAVR